MNTTVRIQIEFDETESVLQEMKDFFTSFGTIYVDKREPSGIKSWGNAIEIVLTIIGTWATEKYILDSLANRASDWIKSIKALREKSGFHRQINIIVKFTKEKNKLELQFIGIHEPDVLDRVWNIAKSVFELAEMQRFSLDKIRITSNTNQSLLIIGYSENRPKYTMDLDKRLVLPIETTPHAEKGEYNPEAETWVISILERRLEYLKFVKQEGYDISETEIINLELEIQSKKDKRSFGGRG